MAGQSLESQGFTQEIIPPYYCVKESVFPFAKFQGVDPILGPEMKSTGEVMKVSARVLLKPLPKPPQALVKRFQNPGVPLSRCVKVTNPVPLIWPVICWS